VTRLDAVQGAAFRRGVAPPLPPRPARTAPVRRAGEPAGELPEVAPGAAARAARIALWQARTPAGQVPICARVCARDAAGHAETGETQKAWNDFMPPVCRGQRGDWRLSETGKTHVAWLITQRLRGAVTGTGRYQVLAATPAATSTIPRRYAGSCGHRIANSRGSRCSTCGFRPPPVALCVRSSLAVRRTSSRLAVKSP
jgi:hypothetical protein